LGGAYIVCPILLLIFKRDSILQELHGQRHLIKLDLYARYGILKKIKIKAPEEYDDFQNIQN
jgi:hypothetical protein